MYRYERESLAARACEHLEATLDKRDERIDELEAAERRCDEAEAEARMEAMFEQHVGNHGWY